MDTPPPYASLEAIDWDRWHPVWRATLLFVIRDGEVLLIHKKRGFGAGKINGPGGRIEPGESPREAAVREVQEELHVEPVGVRYRGELCFQFRDGHSIHGFAFRADDCDGCPEETDEAVPLWVPVADMPYDRMWADDRVWLPHLLADRCFRGWFLFEGERMVQHRLVLPGESAGAQGELQGRGACRER